MPISTESEAAVKRSESLMMASIAVSLAALPCVAIHTTLFSLVLSAGLLLSLATIVWRLFGAIQIQLGELMILIAIVGNMAGLAVMGISDAYSAEHVIYIGLLLIIALVWVLGAVANGLLCARRLEVNDLGSRLIMVLSFLIYPVGLAGMALSVVAGIFFIGMGNPGFFYVAFTFLGSALLWLPGREYRKRARILMTRTRR
jgi:hypothetical protein